jgi:hypothetical protein
MRRLSATADNTTLALRPFWKQPVFKADIFEYGPAISPMKNIIGSMRAKGRGR